MHRRFFELYDDVYVPGRWHLTNPVDHRGQEVDDPWQFTEGHSVVVEGRLRIPVEVPGRALDFTLAGLSVPVVHVRAAEVFTELAPEDVQLLPVEVDGQPGQFFILVVTRLIRCIDEKASRVRFWEPEDGLPEKVGQYSSVRDLRIEPAKVGEARVLRALGWPGPLIVSEDIKKALEHLGATGMKFTEV